MDQKNSILIVGAGFSGLVQAYYLIKKDFKVVICDVQKNVGGLIQTQNINGFLSESAANAFLANSEIESISKDIGIELLPAQSESQIRWFFRRGQLRRWPLDWIESLKLVWPLMWTLVGLRLFGTKALMIKEDESLKDWAKRRFGFAFAEYIMEPAMQGVFASSSDLLSAKLILESLFSPKAKGQFRGSIAPKGGMGEWILHLKKYLESHGVQFKLGLTLSEVDALIEQRLQDKKSIQPLCLAVGLKALKDLNHRIPQLHLPESLEKTQLASLSSVQFFYKKQNSKALKGFGCLFPRHEKFHSLGVLLNQNIFSFRVPEGASETWILNDQKIKFSEMSQSALIRYVQSDRYQLFQEHTEPDYVKVYQWPARLPLYDHNLSDFIKDLKVKPLNFCLIGHYLGDLGLSKIIFHARKNAQNFVKAYDV